MTLNLAHGRARAFAQSRARPAQWFRDNLDVIVQVLAREQPDVVALQEAELGSRWAGDFDHIEYLARRGGFASLTATPHVLAEGRFRYGTAVLAKAELRAHGGTDFAAQARWHKGFTWATIDAFGGPLTLVSVHLDFASAARRRLQARELVLAFADRPEPIVVLGDCNSHWRDEGSPVAAIAAQLELHTEAPLARGPITYPFGRRRLDWILAPDGVEFVDHRVLGDRVSDHRAVLADLTSDGRRRTAAATAAHASPAPRPRAG
ncbi:MAG: endonuclease/exonuclease/phosphatase family protein [Deltaproteobacteria bacterium]|nr:endonuclease/exonuclease/phosphatase family protein [Nannocystaceae bacterium]